MKQKLIEKYNIPENKDTKQRLYVNPKEVFSNQKFTNLMDLNENKITQAKKKNQNEKNEKKANLNLVSLLNAIEVMDSSFLESSISKNSKELKQIKSEKDSPFFQNSSIYNPLNSFSLNSSPTNKSGFSSSQQSPFNDLNLKSNSEEYLYSKYNLDFQEKKYSPSTPNSSNFLSTIDFNTQINQSNPQQKANPNSQHFLSADFSPLPGNPFVRTPNNNSYSINNTNNNLIENNNRLSPLVNHLTPSTPFPQINNKQPLKPKEIPSNQKVVQKKRKKKSNLEEYEKDYSSDSFEEKIQDSSKKRGRPKGSTGTNPNKKKKEKKEKPPIQIREFYHFNSNHEIKVLFKHGRPRQFLQNSGEKVIFSIFQIYFFKITLFF